MGRKVKEGDDDVWIVLLQEASHLVTRLLWVCSGPRVSPNPECVWFFSCATKSGFSCFFFPVFGFSPLQLPMRLALMALGWAGRVWYLWFKCVQVLMEPVGPGSEVVAGRQVVPVGLAVWLVDVYTVGQTRIF